ncbi:Formylglycine-generating enzyme, required for sulfatase activity, contains SUMF1/FGE domain [Nannocystis exedens]|uniref:Formylglycine-generating enzyme, required for sulfatase activity, contains SUMF1/FGE domain n=1 Tax=Nannocystis exedens TaxID=54 RepID=A0A1I2D9Q2_9BACT|nr:SUMF1/EgtB/PvdO family nonheme iron enzyme [Nannocystis exedens]PCC70636.1 Formylglycine-generating sulfatase enzyme [Nannocystis exedens]SFE77275.1 Formylglycine-generating enzyme, required for sulfatase activity, contains SUMF1/FGE domain [Nannocystis exedens]
MLHVAAAPELFDHTLWVSATDDRREELAQLVAAELGPEFFHYEGLRRYGQASAPVAVFVHATVGEMSLVPGGGFDMGLSPEEEEAIRAARDRAEAAAEDFDQEFDLLLSEIGQMRPLHRVVVPPFLIAQRVLSIGRALRWLPNLRDPLYGNVPKAPAHLTPEQITAVLLGTGLRLPAEAELEYAARGGLRRRLLPWGDELPDDATIEAMLADDEGATHNAFGLHGYGLYPELCADHWHEHYRGAPDDGAPWLGSGMHVVRGGAGDCYPWQDCGEWNLMLCAMRMTERAAEFGATVRLVHGLGEHESASAEMAEETGDAKGPERKASAKRTGKTAGVKKAGKAAAKKSKAEAGATKSRVSKPGGKKAGAKKAGKAATKKAGAKKAKKAATKKAGKAAAGVTKSGVSKLAGEKAGVKKAATKKAGKKTATKAAGATMSGVRESGAKKAGRAATKRTVVKKSKTASAQKAGAK